MPPGHGNRPHPGVRNCSPGCLGYWEWSSAFPPGRSGDHFCAPGVVRGRLSTMSSSYTPVRGTRSRVAAALATVIRIVGGLFVLILVAHVALTLGGANPANSITRFVAYWADRLQLGFRGLFTPSDARARIVIDYGLAALFWLVVSWVLLRVVRRLG